MELEGKTAIITGASRGIGKAIALRFFEEGADVVAVARDREALVQLSDETNDRGYPNKLIIWPCDVSREEEVKHMFDVLGLNDTRIDILVNAAGIAEPYAPMFESEFSEWRRVFETNVFGTFLMMKYAIPIMGGNGSGKIVNLGGGGDGLEGFSAYSASKVAIVRLTETAAKEIKLFGININAMAPGPVKTKLFSEMFLSGKFLKSGKTPPIAGDVRKPVELALFLASGRSDGLSGKFLSANWDNWDKIPENINLIMNDSNVFTLRRVKGEL